MPELQRENRCRSRNWGEQSATIGYDCDLSACRPYRVAMDSIQEPSHNDLPELRHRLSTRIVVSSLVALVVVLGMIGTTLWLSWRLEGAGAAINDTGSLRMRANRIAVELLIDQDGRKDRVREQETALDETVALLLKGNAQRPLFLPNDSAIRAQLADVTQYWREIAKPAAEYALESGDNRAYLRSLPELVNRANVLVTMIEHDNAGKTAALRMAQGGLAMLAVMGTLTMIYLLYLWIIAPVLRLRDGLQRMESHEFTMRLPVETRDEFGVLATGYNRMADELQSLYSGLEQRVEEKTHQLARQNLEITALFDMAAFLNQPNDIEALCDGFLQRVMQQFEAEGASLRTLDADHQRLSLVASVGLSRDLTDSEHCMHVNDCYCGEATLGDKVFVIRDMRHQQEAPKLQCQQEGFASVAVFRVVSRDAVLGSFSLHFHQHRDLSESARKVLESFGQLFGVALENRRLDAQARELAVVQERGLVAQGLHDSLAQGLNYLNLQLQMLESAVRRENYVEVREILPLLRMGVTDGYQDVRELLTNFRSKLEQGDLKMAVEETIERFRRHSGCETVLKFQNAHGAPLAPDQQLQVLFILQEALSNIRKHADAEHVHVRIENSLDFVLEVVDDGRGYNTEEVDTYGEVHVGLDIMRERAARMNAMIKLESAPGKGARVALVLPASERLAA